MKVKRSQSKRANRNRRKERERERGVVRESPSGGHDEIEYRVMVLHLQSGLHLINNHEHISRIINCKEVFYYIVKEVY